MIHPCVCRTGRTRWLFTIATALLALAFEFQSLKSQPLANGQDKFLGNIIANGYDIPSNFNSYWNQVTPENAGKWGSAEPSQDNMQWGSLDKIHDYAKHRNFPFRQHNFVWGQQQPGWIGSLSADEQKAEVEEWIELFCQRYPDTDFIDVVNEPLHAPLSTRTLWVATAKPDGTGSSGVLKRRGNTIPTRNCTSTNTA